MEQGVMWYYEKNNGQAGPEEAEQIQRRCQSGELSGSTLVWSEGMTDWLPLSQVAELQPTTALVPAASGDPIYAAPQHPQALPGAAAGLPATQNPLAITSLVLGICALLFTFLCGFGFLLAFPGVVLGHVARHQIRSSFGAQTGDGLAVAGLVMNYIVIVPVIGLLLLGILGLGAIALF